MLSGRAPARWERAPDSPPALSPDLPRVVRRWSLESNPPYRVKPHTIVTYVATLPRPRCPHVAPGTCPDTVGRRALRKQAHAGKKLAAVPDACSKSNPADQRAAPANRDLVYIAAQLGAHKNNLKSPPFSPCERWRMCQAARGEFQSERNSCERRFLP